MKIAVGLFGIHYLENLHHWCCGDNLKVDYETALENIKEYLYQDNDITFYGSTYFSKKLDKLIDYYDFKILKLSQVDNKKEEDMSKNYQKRNKRFKEVMKLILDDNIQYDYVIIHRFDMKFHLNIHDLNINYDKINVINKKADHSIDDNFYLLKYTKLEDFYNKINSIDEKTSAHQYHLYVDIDEFNFMIEDTSSDRVYSVMRFSNE